VGETGHLDLECREAARDPVEQRPGDYSLIYPLRRECLEEFGLARPGDPPLEGDTVELPCVEATVILDPKGDSYKSLTKRQRFPYVHAV
jgi:hypothetical protein